MGSRACEIQSVSRGSLKTASGWDMQLGGGPAPSEVHGPLAARPDRRSMGFFRDGNRLNDALMFKHAYGWVRDLKIVDGRGG